MALETGTYISDLNSSNPVATDGLAQADDHIRLVKSTIKATLPGLTGAVTSTHTDLNTLDGYTGNTADLNILSGAAAAGVTSTELGHLDGVSSALQTQIDSKQATVTGAASTIVSSDLTADRALLSDSSGKVAVSTVTSIKLGYLSDVTSSIQTQLNNKASTSGQATATWQTGTGTIESLVSPAKVAASATEVVGNYALGVDQTWQDMTSSRAFNTTYQNTTGRPIFIGVSAQVSGGSTMSLLVSPNSNMSSSVTVDRTSDINDPTGVSAIIPNNIYYKASVVSASGLYWAELR